MNHSPTFSLSPSLSPILSLCRSPRGFVLDTHVNPCTPKPQILPHVNWLQFVYVNCACLYAMLFFVVALTQFHNMQIVCKFCVFADDNSPQFYLFIFVGFPGHTSAIVSLNDINKFIIIIVQFSSALTPSSLPCNKCTAPERWMPGKNHMGCVKSNRSISPKSHGGELSLESRELSSSLDVSPSAKMPPSELETRDPRDCKDHK